MPGPREHQQRAAAQSRQRGQAFRVYADLTAYEKAGDPNGMRIGGLVSTDELDQDGERIVQEGLDFSHFLQRGWFNDNHSKKTTDVLGYPSDAQYVRKGQALPNGQLARANGWWAEGYLINNDEGRKLWGLIQSLEETPRKLGFSIEGKVKARDPRNPTTVLRAAVHNVAVTHVPVNTSTELQSLMKALTAGHAINSGDMNQGPGDASALRVESLDRKLTTNTYEDEDDDTTTEEPHMTSEEVGEAVISKADDFDLEPIDEHEYIASWAHAASEIDPNPGTFDQEEARMIVKSEHPELDDAAIDRIVNNARGA